MFFGRMGSGFGRMGALGTGGLPNLPRFYQALAEYRAGTRDLKIAPTGDSTTRGTRPGGGTAAYQTGWPVQFAQLLASGGYNANWSNVMATGGTALPTTADSRVTSSGGWIANTSTAGGLFFRSTSAGTLTITPPEAFDRYEVVFGRTGQAGAATVNIDGGSTAYTYANGTAAMVSSGELTTTLGTHAINIPWVSGTAYKHSVKWWNSALGRRIDVLNFGWASSEAVNNWAFGTSAWSPRNALNFFAPDLIILNLGLNDVDNGATTSAQFGTALQALIDAWSPTSDIVLCTFTPADTTWESIARQDEWIAVARSIAASNGVPLLDHYARRGSYAADTSLYSDNVHGSLTGYAEMAAATKSFLRL